MERAPPGRAGGLAEQRRGRGQATGMAGNAGRGGSPGCPRRAGLRQPGLGRPALRSGPGGRLRGGDSGRGGRAGRPWPVPSSRPSPSLNYSPSLRYCPPPTPPPPARRLPPNDVRLALPDVPAGHRLQHGRQEHPPAGVGGQRRPGRGRGAGVRALLRLPPVRLWTAMCGWRTSLRGGVSTFLAEARRIKAVVDAARGTGSAPAVPPGRAVPGTNARERANAAAGDRPPRGQRGHRGGGDARPRPGGRPPLPPAARPVHFAETVAPGAGGPGMTFRLPRPARPGHEHQRPARA